MIPVSAVAEILPSQIPKLGSSATSRKRFRAANRWPPVWQRYLDEIALRKALWR
jgi:hypothetical protein